MRVRCNFMVDIVNETDIDFDKSIFDFIFDMMKSDSVFVSDATVTLKLSKNNEIKGLNSRFRGCDSVTDVLTFPCCIPNIAFIGDIIVDVGQAERQRGSRTLEKEVCILFIHGLLHLAGFDHLSKKESERMYLYENKYRDRLNKERNNLWK